MRILRILAISAIMLNLTSCDKKEESANLLFGLKVSRSEEHTSELQSRGHLVAVHSFPTRRSSDLCHGCKYIKVLPITKYILFYFNLLPCTLSKQNIYEDT